MEVFARDRETWSHLHGRKSGIRWRDTYSLPMKKGNERRWQKRKRGELVQTFHGSPRGGVEKRALASSRSLHPHFNIFLYLSLRPSATTRWHRDFLSTSRPNCKQTVNNVLVLAVLDEYRIKNYAIFFTNFLIIKF